MYQLRKNQTQYEEEKIQLKGIIVELNRKRNLNLTNSILYPLTDKFNKRLYFKEIYQVIQINLTKSSFNHQF